MASLYDSWTYDNAARHKPVPRWLAANRAFYEGDHWQREKGWIGPHVSADTSLSATELMQEVERGFVSVNKVEEGVNRHRDAVCGHPVIWHWAPRRFLQRDEQPTAQESTGINEIEASMTRWWDEKGLMDLVQEATSTLLWAARAAIRNHVPSGFIVTTMDEDGDTIRGVLASTLDEALYVIFPEHPRPEDGFVYIDPKTKEQVAVLFVNRTNDDGSVDDYVELTYRDGPDIVYRQLPRSPKRTAPSQVRIRALGPLPFVEMRLKKPLISESVRQNQRALNFANTMIPRNLETGGFLERTMLNAEMPGDWEYNEAGEKVNFVPKHYTLGAGSTAWLQGTSYKDAQGNTNLANPSITYREPIDPKPATNSAGHHERNMLSEMRQEHILTNTETLMSGKSREQARAGFEGSVRPTKRAVERLVQEIQESALALAEWFLGTPGRWTSKYRCVATCRIDIGPVSPEEREQDAVAVTANAMSLELYMERSGIQDVDAERNRIRNDPLYQLNLWSQRFKVMKEGTEAGLSAEAVAELMDLGADVLAVIKKDREQALAEAKELNPPEQPPQEVAA